MMLEGPLQAHCMIKRTVCVMKSKRKSTYYQPERREGEWHTGKNCSEKRAGVVPYTIQEAIKMFEAEN